MLIVESGLMNDGIAEVETANIVAKNAAISITETAENRHFQEVVGETGFEPATLWSQTRCATRLRYSPTGITMYRPLPVLFGH